MTALACSRVWLGLVTHFGPSDSCRSRIGPGPKDRRTFGAGPAGLGKTPRSQFCPMPPICPCRKKLFLAEQYHCSSGADGYMLAGNPRGVRFVLSARLVVLCRAYHCDHCDFLPILLACYLPRARGRSFALRIVCPICFHGLANQSAHTHNKLLGIYRCGSSRSLPARRIGT